MGTSKNSNDSQKKMPQRHEVTKIHEEIFVILGVLVSWWQKIQVITGTLMKTDRATIHQTISYVCLLLIAITLPFAVSLNSYIINIFALNWLIEGNFSKKFRILIKNKTALLFMSFYVLYIIGLSYTSNMAEGMFVLEKKLSLFVFPFLLSTTVRLKKVRLENILKVFVLACITGAIICTVKAAYQYFVNGDSEQLYYHQLSSAINIHAVYFSCYLSFSIFILVYFLLKKWDTIRNITKISLLFLIAFITVFILLLASKTIIITLFLFANLFVILLYYSKNKIRAGLVIIFSINLALAILFMNMPNTKERFKDVMNLELKVIKEDKYKSWQTQFTGITMRLVFWKYSFEILNENNAWLCGIGTGDGQMHLDNSYYEHNIYTGNIYLGCRGYLGYNPHNQYIQTLLYIGLLGFICLLICLIYPMITSFKQKTYLYLAFLILFAIFSFTESTLETHKGTVFYAFFNSLFAFHYLCNLKTGST